MDLSQLTEAVELISPYITLVSVCSTLIGMLGFWCIGVTTDFILNKIKKFEKERSATNESQSTWHTQS